MRDRGIWLTMGDPLLCVKIGPAGPACLPLDVPWPPEIGALPVRDIRASPMVRMLKASLSSSPHIAS